MTCTLQYCAEYCGLAKDLHHQWWKKLKATLLTDQMMLASSFNRGSEFKLHLKSCIPKRKWWLSYMSN